MTFKEKLKMDKELRGLVQAMEDRFQIPHDALIDYSGLLFQYGQQTQRMENLNARLLDAEPSGES